jgi:hypothetical protein
VAAVASELKDGGAVPIAPEVNDASAMPLAIVGVVTQFDELGMLNGALGVTVSPTVYGVGCPSAPVKTPVKNWAKVENCTVPSTVAVGYQPGGYATSASHDSLENGQCEAIKSRTLHTKSRGDYKFQA